MKGWGKDKLNRFLLPYLKNLTSFVPFVGDNISDGIEKWMQSGNPADRVNEIQLFFRQYAKVVAYVQDRRSRLKRQVAEEKFKSVGKGYNNLEDAMDNEAWMEKYVYSDDTYKNFMGGKLHQSIVVMKNNNLFDTQMSKDMEKIVKACDGERDSILNIKDGKDALGRLRE
ncbi:hypothetical protein FACS1894176_01740 [Bacteroidia bacterium]|nr:hypothetical protein FACS1894176_01740 [Bacteroidia bacterium]